MSQIRITVPLMTQRTGRDLTALCNRCCQSIRESVVRLRGDTIVPPSLAPLCYRNIPLSEVQTGVSTVANLLQSYFLDGDRAYINDISIAHSVTIFGIQCNTLGDAHRAAAQLGVGLALLQCDVIYGPASQYVFGMSMHPKNMISKMSRPELQTVCNDGTYDLECTAEVLQEPFLHALFRAVLGKIYGFLATNTEAVAVYDNNLAYPRTVKPDVTFSQAIRGNDYKLRSTRWCFIKAPITVIERDGSKPKPLPWLSKEIQQWDPLYSYFAVPQPLIPDFIAKHGCCLRYMLPLAPSTLAPLSEDEQAKAVSNGYVSTASLSIIRPCGKYPYVSYDYSKVEAAIFTAYHDGVNAVRGVSYDEVFYAAFNTSLLDMFESGCNGDVTAPAEELAFDVITSRDQSHDSFDLMSYRRSALEAPAHTYRCIFWSGGLGTVNSAYKIDASTVSSDQDQLIQSRIGLTARCGATLHRRSYVFTDIDERHVRELLQNSDTNLYGLVYTNAHGRVSNQQDNQTQTEA